MKYSLLVLLTFAVAGFGQEGPWEILSVDTGWTVRTPQLTVIDSVAIEVYYTSNIPTGGTELRFVRYDLQDHDLVGEPGTCYISDADTLVAVDVQYEAADGAILFWTGSGGTSDLQLLSGLPETLHLTNLYHGTYVSHWPGYSYWRAIESSLRRYDYGWSAAWTVYWADDIGYCVQVSWLPAVAVIDTTGAAQIAVSNESWGDVLDSKIFPHLTQLTGNMFLLFGGDFGLKSQSLVLGESGWSWMSRTDIPWNGILKYVEQTGGGRWLIFAPADSWNSTSRVFEIHFGDGCELLGTVDHSGSPVDIAWDPNYGFAALYASASALELVRVDTNGVQTLPAGTMLWRDSLHTFADASVAITDSGKIVMVWTEKRTDEPATRRLMLATVGWDTPLSASPSDFIPQPTSLSLSAYPNPFNPTTTISFELPRDGQVTLEVYDLMGRLVRTLVNESLRAGSHQIAFDGSQLASGIYWSRLNAGGRQVVRKMVLMR